MARIRQSFSGEQIQGVSGSTIAPHFSCPMSWAHQLISEGPTRAQELHMYSELSRLTSCSAQVLSESYKQKVFWVHQVVNTGPVRIPHTMWTQGASAGPWWPAGELTVHALHSWRWDVPFHPQSQISPWVEPGTLVVTASQSSLGTSGSDEILVFRFLSSVLLGWFRWLYGKVEPSFTRYSLN